MKELSFKDTRLISGAKVLPSIDDPMSGLVIGSWFGSLCGAGIAMAPFKLVSLGMDETFGYGNNASYALDKISMPFGMVGAVAGGVLGAPVGALLGSWILITH